MKDFLLSSVSPHSVALFLLISLVRSLVGLGIEHFICTVPVVPLCAKPPFVPCCLKTRVGVRREADGGAGCGCRGVGLVFVGDV